MISANTISTKDDRLYETWDLYVAAYHSLQGAEVTCRMMGRKALFSIMKSPDFAISHGLYMNNGEVPAMDYAQKIKMLRVRMNQTRFEGRDIGGK
jgi:hypothetical protein